MAGLAENFSFLISYGFFTPPRLSSVTFMLRFWNTSPGVRCFRILRRKNAAQSPK